MRTFEEYYNGYEEDGKHQAGYKELAENLLQEYPLCKLNPSIPVGSKDRLHQVVWAIRQED